MRLTTLLILLFVLVGLLLILNAFTTAEITHVTPATVPPPTADDTVTAQASAPFQALISYTERGFEPSAIDITSGDTVRFVNNSNDPLWLAATTTDSTTYPASGSSCGSSTIESCHALMPHEYIQLTYTRKGDWDFQNNLDEQKSGSVIAQ